MPTERLDVEDDAQREARLRQLLQRTNNSTASASNNNNDSSPLAALPGPSSFDFGVCETHPVQPPTHLLSRLEEFLPQMEAANADLAHRIEAHPESVDIEHLGDTGLGQYIEMNLGLGVFDVRGRHPSGDIGFANTATSSSSSSVSATSSSGTSSSSESNGSDLSDDDTDDLLQERGADSDPDASPSVIPGMLPLSQ
ncbi:uncharacterized protein FOMMEDRAFT_167086, partial [Fomitiporia mediterranea MF3/22]|uniref:uncharacterized protein n=1 Tax=Fomitiporia mediterranea (strain MF3/22) TaxID=694068 RepID=UPI00044076A5